MSRRPTYRCTHPYACTPTCAHTRAYLPARLPCSLELVSPGRFWGPDGGQTPAVCELHPSRLAWRMQSGTPGGKGGNRETWNSSQEKAADASTSRRADMLRKLSKASLSREARAPETTDSRMSVCLILRSGNTLRSEIKAFGNLDLESKSQHIHLNKSQGEELGHWLGWDPSSHPAPPFPSLVLPGCPTPRRSPSLTGCHCPAWGSGLFFCSVGR